MSSNLPLWNFGKIMHIQRFTSQNCLSSNASRQFWNADGLNYRYKFNRIQTTFHTRTRHAKKITKLLNTYVFKPRMLHLSNFVWSQSFHVQKKKKGTFLGQKMCIWRKGFQKISGKKYKPLIYLEQFLTKPWVSSIHN